MFSLVSSATWDDVFKFLVHFVVASNVWKWLPTLHALKLNIPGEILDRCSFTFRQYFLYMCNWSADGGMVYGSTGSIFHYTKGVGVGVRLYRPRTRGVRKHIIWLKLGYRRGGGGRDPLASIPPLGTNGSLWVFETKTLILLALNFLHAERKKYF